jgi:serpin B
VVPMMKSTQEMSYAETEHAQVVAIPFQGGFAELLVVLPMEGVTLSDATAQEDLATWTGALAVTKVALSLPRFTASMRKDLKVPLQALGVRAAFDKDKSGFTRLAVGEPLVISAILHGARIVVDENGAEATAATAAVFVAGSRPKVVEPKLFVADHPFLFAIRHRSSGTVMFLGRVADPSAG